MLKSFGNPLSISKSCNSEIKKKKQVLTREPYIGKYSRRSKIVLNTGYKKISKINGKFEEDCREMTEEHILEDVN